MQLRHISPRSIDWMDAMDEGSGGRGWEKLAPEERTKLLRDRQGESPTPGIGRGSERRPPKMVAQAERTAGYFASASPSR
jgi:hypothetical protein